jgi:NitT/TauT family transport system substrate-binding protein
MKQHAYPAVALLLSLLALIGCKNEKVAEKTRQADIKIALMPTLECLPFFYAQNEGIFDSLGITVEIDTFYAAMNCDTAFTRKHVDASVSDIDKALVMKSNGDPVSILMSTECELYLLTARKARISSKESLKEKIIAITRNSQTDHFLDKVAQSAKLKPEEINRPQINDVAIRTNMLTQYQYDGAVLPEPYASACISKGCKLIASSSDLGLNLSVVVVNSSIALKKPALCKKLIECYNVAVSSINTDIQNKRYRHLIDMLPANVTVPDSSLTIKPFHTAAMPSAGDINEATGWIQSRNLEGKRNYSDITTDFIK